MSSSTKSNHFLSLPLFLIATLMLVIGALAIYSPQLLQQYLPTEYLDYFSRYSWLATSLCIAGLSLHVAVMIYKLTRPRTAVVRSFKDLDEVEEDSPQINQPVRGPIGPITKAKARISRFYTGKLVHKNDDVIKVKASGASLMFLAILLVGAVVATAMLCIQMVGVQTVEDMLIPAALSLLFFLVGLLSLYKFAQPVVFDRKSGYFWNGYAGAKIPNMVLRNAKPLTRIHALQVLGGNGRNSGYELNLVMTDRSRINLMEHRCPRALSGCAKRLAEFLNVPLWKQVL